MKTSLRTRFEKIREDYVICMDDSKTGNMIDEFLAAVSKFGDEVIGKDEENENMFEEARNDLRFVQQKRKEELLK